MARNTKARRPAQRLGWLKRASIVGEAWQGQGLFVISQVADVETNGVSRETWIVSVTKQGALRRPTDDEMRRVRVIFGMIGADEDNHYPGRSRTLFMAVDPLYRAVCECKVEETTVVESDGYRWQDDGTREALRVPLETLWGTK